MIQVRLNFLSFFLVPFQLIIVPFKSCEKDLKKEEEEEEEKKNRSEIVRIALMLVLRLHRFTIRNKICIPERGRAVALTRSLFLSLSLSLSLTTHNCNKLTTAEIRCNSMPRFPGCHRRVSFTDYLKYTRALDR